MGVKSIIKTRFPFLYQRIYELRTNSMIRKNKKKTEEEELKNLAKIYKKRTGNILNINDPRRYTEKIQWRKFFDRSEEYSVLSDKLAVRTWVESKIGKEYLIHLLGSWDKYEDIDFNILPEKFVLKTNNASGTNVLIKDKSKINHRLLKRKFNYWLNFDYSNYAGYEKHYTKIEPKIICEELIETSGDSDLPDYKFLCFDGEVKYIWVDEGRYHDHKRAIFDTNWNLQPFQQANYQIATGVSKPVNLEKMIEIATELSKGFDHVRVDLYNDNGKIYFGEMTFTNGSGLEPFFPDKYDFILGDFWKLKSHNN